MATEKRLIDANAYVDELKWLQEQVSSASAIEIQEYIDRTNRQPTVEAVEVVRCWECKFWDMCSIREAMAVSDWNAYCYRGERKHNDNRT